MTWHPDIPEAYRNQIVTGDARALAAQIPDESIDLIFTDPVYERIEDYAWLAETAARVLKPGGHLLAWQATPYIPETTQALGQHLVYRHTLSMTRSNIASLACRAYMFTHWTPCFWYAKNHEARPVARFRDSIDDPFIVNPNVNHKWHKPMKTTSAWLQAFSRAGDVVVDFFVGGGTTAVACKLFNRNYIAFEIDPSTASAARTRIENTQAMHPLFVADQAELDLSAA